MLEKISDFDTQLFIYLNNLGSESYDKLWLFITNQFSWLPLFLLFLYFIYKKIGGKQTLYLLLFIAILIAVTDQITNVFKYGFERLRPCNNPEIESLIRIVVHRKSFSFFSGHAANTTAVATFLYLLFRKKFRYLGFIFLWPLIFSYSRIYLGLHYPLDLICGYLCGITTGISMFYLYKWARKKYFLEKNQV